MHAGGVDLIALVLCLVTLNERKKNPDAIPLQEIGLISSFVPEKVFP